MSRFDGKFDSVQKNFYLLQRNFATLSFRLYVVYLCTREWWFKSISKPFTSQMVEAFSTTFSLWNKKVDVLHQKCWYFRLFPSIRYYKVKIIILVKPIDLYFQLSTFPVFQQFGLIFRDKFNDIGITETQTTFITNLTSAFSAALGGYFVCLMQKLIHLSLFHIFFIIFLL